jgi:hypothetical protein
VKNGVKARSHFLRATLDVASRQMVGELLQTGGLAACEERIQGADEVRG